MIIKIIRKAKKLNNKHRKTLSVKCGLIWLNYKNMQN